MEDEIPQLTEEDKQALDNLGPNLVSIVIALNKLEQYDSESTEILNNEIKRLRSQLYKTQMLLRETSDNCNCYDEYQNRLPTAPCEYCRARAFLKSGEHR